jgi:hypothetical protein
MSSVNVGSIHYDLKLNTSNFDSASKQVDSKLQGVQNSIIATAKKIAIATTAIATASGAFAIKSAADLEQTRIGIENMLGSADKARKLLGQISEYAQQTPFEFPELADATRQLIAFGFTGKDAFETMKQLGDVSAAIGAPMGDLAYLMGTLKTQGRAFTIDIRQFAQRGVPIYEYLAKVLKTNEKTISQMIEDGKIGFPEVQKAIQAMTSEGGKFYNTMDKQSKSLTGRFSTLKDTIGLVARELVGITREGDIKAGSLLDKLKTAIDYLIRETPKAVEKIKAVVAQIAEYLEPKIASLVKVVRESFGPALADLIKTFGPTVGKGLVWALGLVIDILKIFLQILTPVINFMKNNTPVVWAMVGAFVAFKAALLINRAVGTFIAMSQLLRADMLVTIGRAAKVRLALLALAKPWQITLAIAGVGAIVYGINQIRSAFQRVKQEIRDINATPVKVGPGDLQVSGGSDLGMLTRLRNAFSGWRASGGPVSAGKSYIVGEKGMEWFVPNQSGTIVPNNQIGTMSNGNITTNIYGDIKLSNEIDVNNFFGRLTRNQELASKNIATRAGALG